MATRTTAKNILVVCDQCHQSVERDRLVRQRDENTSIIKKLLSPHSRESLLRTNSRMRTVTGHAMNRDHNVTILQTPSWLSTVTLFTQTGHEYFRVMNLVTISQSVPHPQTDSPRSSGNFCMQNCKHNKKTIDRNMMSNKRGHWGIQRDGKELEAPKKKEPSETGKQTDDYITEIFPGH